MGQIIWILLGAVFLGLMFYNFFAPSLDKELAETLREGNIDPLRSALGKISLRRQPNAYNTTIHKLWGEYRRDLAVIIIRDFAEKHHSSKIAQYWLEQVRTVEPELAARHFDEDFFAKYYHPEVAQSCGSAA